MVKSVSCGKCGSGEVLQGVRPIGGAHEEQLKVQVFEKPNATLFKGAVSVPLLAHVCGACGFTELYAQEPERLLEARRRAKHE